MQHSRKARSRSRYFFNGLLVFATALFGLLPLAGCARKTHKPNVLFIVVDTLRADRLGVLSGGDLTPNLDALAQRSVVFAHATSPRAKTTPAMASLMTGLYPHDHHVRDLTTPLQEDVPVFAELMREAGYSTAAIIGNYVLQRKLSGLNRGFELWVEELPDVSGEAPNDVAFRNATSITDGALLALGLAGAVDSGAEPPRKLPQGKPWFMWLHYMDPHGLYEPPAQHLRTPQGPTEFVPAPPRPGDGAFHRQWVADYNIPAEARTPQGIDAQLVRSLYDGEVRYVDEQIGRLLAELEHSGVLANTLVVFLSDHGESLGEHDYWFEHGRYAYEATCHIPLFIHFPPEMRDAPQPGVVNGDIALVDVVPTLTEVLRLPAMRPPFRGHSAVRGRSRASLLIEDSDRPHPVFCEKVERSEKAKAIQSKAVRLGQWKFIRRYTHLVDLARDERQLMVLSEELYDLASDPSEAHNLVREVPAGAPLEELKEALLRFSGADAHFAELAQLLQRRRDELGREDPETLRALRALGY